MRIFMTVAIAAGSLAIAGMATAQEEYRFGGGPSGGAWHPAVSAGTQLLNQELTNVSFQYSPSAGSVDNVRRVGLGEFSMGWGHIGQIYEAWNGIGLFKEDGKTQDFRVIARVRAQSQIIAVLADNPIHSFSDMEGRVVNLLSRGSGSNVNCMNVFTSLGLMDKIEDRYLGFAEAGRALGDRQIDVYCSAGVPNQIPALTQLSISKPVRYISMTEDEQAKIIEDNAFYAPYTIPVQDDVQGMDEPARTIAYDVWWIAHESVSDEAIYDTLAAIADKDNLAQLTQTAAYWKDLSGEFAALEPLGILVHPAAARYWEEHGADVPDAIVKGYE